MGANTAVVQVGVSLNLQNLKETISEAQKALSGLRVGSSPYRETEKEINKLIKLVDTLQVHTSQPFKAKNDFGFARKELKAFEESMRNIGRITGKVSFSDLQLTPQEIQSLKPYNDEVIRLEGNLKNLQETAKKNVVGSDLFKRATGKMANKSASLPYLNLGKMATEIDKEYKRLNNLMVTKQAQLGLKLHDNPSYASYDIISKLLGDVKGKNWSDILPTSIFDQYFKKDGSFLSDGIREAFINSLKSIKIIPDNLSKDVLNGLMGSNGSDLLTKVSDMLKTNNYGRTLLQNTQKTSYATEEQSLANMKVALGEILELYKFIRQEIERVNTATTEDNGRLAEARESLRKKQDDILNDHLMSNPIGEQSKAVENFRLELTRMRSELESSSVQFTQLQASMRTFDYLKRTVANFLGFNQVLRWTRQAISSAMKNIKELDDVMTSISVVTDFSQSDLWGQMDTYASIAQEYAVSIKGVYEVSQIYY